MLIVTISIQGGSWMWIRVRWLPSSSGNRTPSQSKHSYMCYQTIPLEMARQKYCGEHYVMIDEWHKFQAWFTDWRDILLPTLNLHMNRRSRSIEDRSKTNRWLVHVAKREGLGIQTKPMNQTKLWLTDRFALRVGFQHTTFICGLYSSSVELLL